MYKVLQTWHNDEFFYANVEETRRFFFKKIKCKHVIYTDWFKHSKARGNFFRYADNGSFVLDELNEAVEAYEARKKITDGAARTI